MFIKMYLHVFIPLLLSYSFSMAQSDGASAFKLPASVDDAFYDYINRFPESEDSINATNPPIYASTPPSQLNFCSNCTTALDYANLILAPEYISYTRTGKNWSDVLGWWIMEAIPSDPITLVHRTW